MSGNKGVLECVPRAIAGVWRGRARPEVAACHHEQRTLCGLGAVGMGGQRRFWVCSPPFLLTRVLLEAGKQLQKWDQSTWGTKRSGGGGDERLPGFCHCRPGAGRWDGVLGARRCPMLVGVWPGAPGAVGDLWACGREGVGRDGLLGLAGLCGTPGRDPGLAGCPTAACPRRHWARRTRSG